MKHFAIAATVLLAGCNNSVENMRDSTVAIYGENSEIAGSAVHIGHGEFLTAAHVIEMLGEVVTIKTRDGRETEAEVVFQDEKLDFALLVNSDYYGPSAKLSCRELRVGEEVWSVGHPRSELWTFFRGMVASEAVELPSGETAYRVQIPIAPG